jgi:ribosomal protein S27AE
MAKKPVGKQHIGRRPYRTCPECGEGMELVFLKIPHKKHLHWSCGSCNTYIKKVKGDITIR